MLQRTLTLLALLSSTVLAAPTRPQELFFPSTASLQAACTAGYSQTSGAEDYFLYRAHLPSGKHVALSPPVDQAYSTCEDDAEGGRLKSRTLNTSPSLFVVVRAERLFSTVGWRVGVRFEDAQGHELARLSKVPEEMGMGEVNEVLRAVGTCLSTARCNVHQEVGYSIDLGPLLKRQPDLLRQAARVTLMFGVPGKEELLVLDSAQLGLPNPEQQ